MFAQLKKVFKSNIWQKLLIVGLLVMGWEVLAKSGHFNALLLPSFSAVALSFVEQLKAGYLLNIAWFSIVLLLKGLLISLALALALSSLAMLSGLFDNLVNVLNSVLHPLPGIALLPVAMLWFGLTEGSIIFIIVHSVVWPLVISMLIGFRSIPPVNVEAARNFGVKGLGLIWGVMLPASAPYLFSGLKIGWARAWQAAIAGEMVFGAVGTAGGLGWHIFKTRYDFDIVGTFAALLTIMIVGIIIEEIIFKKVEKATIEKWGMSN